MSSPTSVIESLALGRVWYQPPTDLLDQNNIRSAMQDVVHILRDSLTSSYIKRYPEGQPQGGRRLEYQPTTQGGFHGPIQP